MRKLILNMALVIISVGVYAQAPADNCTPTPNKPEIGSNYSYSVEVPSAPHTNHQYHWYVTQNKNLIDKAHIIPSTDKYFGVVSGDYNSENGTSNNLQLTWKPDALESTTPFYLVVKYKGNNGVCDVSNIKALRIDPLNKFQLDVKPVKNENGDPFVDGQEKVCVADVTSATIEGDKVKYVYGETILYYRISISGFSGQWKPSISLPELLKNNTTDAESIRRRYKSIEWKLGTGNFQPFRNDFTASSSVTNLQAENSTSETSFILKVTIENGTYEGLTEESIALSSKGNMILNDGTLGKRDVDNNCNELTDDNNKKGSQIILARPTIQAKSGEFIIQIQ